MRRIYSVLAWIIAGGVFVQAMSLAFGVGGESHFVQEGGVIDKALAESETADFTGVAGVLVHGIVGGLVIPLAALALLVVAFFVRAPKARTWAAGVFGLVVVQVMAGYSITDVPYLGILHGGNALLVLLAAIRTARLVPTTERSAADAATRVTV
jgi:heme A synthase